MAESYVYLAGDPQKTHLDLSRQAAGTPLVFVADDGQEYAVKAGELVISDHAALALRNAAFDQATEKRVPRV